MQVSGSSKRFFKRIKNKMYASNLFTCHCNKNKQNSQVNKKKNTIKTSKITEWIRGKHNKTTD